MRYTTLFSALAMASLLAACGGNDDSNTPPDTTPRALKVHYSGIRLGSDNLTQAFIQETGKNESHTVTQLSGDLTFTAEYHRGDNYTVTITGPAGYTCAFAGTSSASKTGTFPAADVALEVNCVAPGMVSGSIQDNSSGAAVAGALISVDGKTATTDANGAYQITDIPYGDFALNVEKTGYAEQGRPVHVRPSGESIRLDMPLLPGQASTFDAANAATLTISNTPAQVVLPSNALVTTNGTAASGTITATLTAIDPSGGNTNVMPGDFSAVAADGTTRGTLESFGALSVVFKDGAGNTLNLANGKTATIRIPVASGAVNPPASIPLFYYDEASGLWKEEGTATLSGDKTYYEGTVSHFTTWNADQMMTTSEIVGCVKDEAGQPVTGAWVYSSGLDYIGSSIASSDTAGNFRVAARSASRALIYARLPNGQMTNSLVVDPTAAAGGETSVSNCLTLVTGGALTVKLSWGENPSDLDSWFFGVNPADSTKNFWVYYGNPLHLNGSDWDVNLDVDDTTSYGPEVITVKSFPFAGTYRYAVDHYSGSSTTWQSPARVEVNLNGQTRIFTAPTASAPTDTYSQSWVVFDITVDASGNITLTPVNQWMADDALLTWANVNYTNALVRKGQKK